MTPSIIPAMIPGLSRPGLPEAGQFDLCGPLPHGTTVLEASAGTGKTYTVAGLVTRYVAEGVAAMDELLVVSFSREATRELRERVRERLVAARDGLAARSGRSTNGPDPLLDHLADAPAAELENRCRRLADACASFDAATVTTTHGFCQQVLLALGTACDHDPESALVEDLRDLVHEVADDLYLRKWGVAGSPPPQPELRPAAFRELALEVCRDRATPLLPGADAAGLPLLRRKVAEAVQNEVEKRKRRLRMIDYDDLLLRLAETLRDPDAGQVARQRLRDRYRVVLVDEFQDTDPVQWSILRDAFHGHRTLVLIGDPKQSIYRFRGADVYSYLEAAADADARATLLTNHRSDRLLLAGLDAVLHGASLGDPRIHVLPVQAAEPGPGLVVDGAPARLRVLPRDGLPITREGLATVGPAREAVAQDVAAQAVQLLSATGRRRRLQPAELAVLVRTNQQAQLIKRELNAAGVPAVLTGRRSVFAAPAAREWQLLLEAMEQPHRATRVHRFAVGALVGAGVEALAEPAGTLGHQLALRLRLWVRVLEERGVAALFEAVCLAQDVPPRLLGEAGGERLLTDLRHIAQALHEAVLAGRLGLTATLTWLRRRREEATTDGGLERSQRLESDAAAVQVITVHTSKGLQFPVVMVPFAWDLWVRQEPTTAVFHQDNRRHRDVGGPGGPGWNAHRDAHQQEEIDEELRLTYVALTRAESHLLTWWVASTNTACSPLHRLLLHEDPAVVAPKRIRVPSDSAALAAFQARAAAGGGGLAVELVVPGDPGRWSAPAAARDPLAAAALSRPLDSGWRRTSYSALTRGSHEQRLGSEPERASRQDEADTEAVPAQRPDPDQALLDLPSGWDALPGGAGFGTLVHAALEQLTDPADDAQVAAVVAAALGRGTSQDEVDRLTGGLLDALATPLGPLADGLALRDLPARDRLAELEFELPLSGGDDPTTVPAQTVLADLVPLWRAHCGPGPMAGYADVLAELEPVPLRGYLTGSIDVVLRAHGPRYLVVDYKTNRLGAPDEPLTAWHYRPQALAEAMIEAHYPLQALLYSVALHRYLRWRQPGYDPERQLGGVLYLFLRGMRPDRLCSDGSAPGVFAWRPPAPLVTEVSQLLAGHALVTS